MLCDARYDSTCFQSVVNLELQQLVGFRHFLTFKDGTNTDVEFREIIKFDVRTNRVCLIVGFFVGLLRVEQLLYLCLDYAVFYFFEQQFRLVQLMSYREQIVPSQFRPFEAFHVQHLAKFLRAERQERFESDGKVGNQLQRDVQDGAYTFHVGLCQFPGFGVGKVFVADACQVHRLFLRVAKFEYVEQLFYFCLYVGKFFQGFFVVIRQFCAGGYFAVEVFLSQHHCTVHEVTVYGYQLIVVACLEVFPCEVVVLRFRSIGGQYVAEYVLFAGEVFQIFVQPYRPVAGSRNLVSFQIQEFVARHVVRQDIASFRFQHGGEYDAVEYDIVLSDEVEQACFGVFPPCLPTVGKQFLGIGNVSDRSIEPHVQYLSFRTFYGHRDTPVEVTADGTRLQSHVEPALALSVYVGAPFLVVFQNPLAQPSFVFVEGKIPVLGLLHHRFAAADGALRVDQIGGRQGGSAFLALVAIGTFRMAVRTLTGDVAVGEECFRFFVVILFGCFFDKLSFVV